MKLILENWRKKMLNKNITVLPTQANVAALYSDLYSSYLENLDFALKNLVSLKTLFEREVRDTENIDSIIKLLEDARDDEMLKHDMEDCR